MARTFNDTVKTAIHGAESVRGGAEHTLVNTLSVLVKAVGAVAGVVSILRSLDRDDGLAWFGVGRRRHPFRPLILLGSGLVAGAAAGVLFAPMAGGDLRGALLGRSEKLKPQAKAVAGAAEHLADGAGPTNGANVVETTGTARSTGVVRPG